MKCHVTLQFPALTDGYFCVFVERSTFLLAQLYLLGSQQSFELLSLCAFLIDESVHLVQFYMEDRRYRSDVAIPQRSTS